MYITAKEIANQYSGKILGDATVAASSFASLDKAQKGDISFLSNEKYENLLYSTSASIVLVNKTFELDVSKSMPQALILVDDPYLTFALLLRAFENEKLNKSGLEKFSIVDDSAKIGKDVYVGACSYISKNVVLGDGVKIFPNCFIGEHVQIGANSIIYPNVTIYYDCILKENVILHSGCVIGSDGFGFAPKKGKPGYEKIPQVGNVLIEENVEIGANTVIDRATLNSTIIRKGVKLDNLIQIAHNIEVGENTAMAAQVGIAGSTVIGKNCVFGGQVGVVGHIKIADGSSFQAKSGVNNSVKEENENWGGWPLMPLRKNLKTFALIKQLETLKHKIECLEKELYQIQQPSIQSEDE